MVGMVLLIGCFVLGALARRFTTLPRDSHRAINAWVLTVSMPAFIIRLIHTVPLTGNLVWAVTSLWAVFAVPAVGALLWARRAPEQRNGIAGALALCVGLGSTAFVGYPLCCALGGPSALPTAAVADQLGTFVALSLGAVPLATHLSGKPLSLLKVLKRLVTFPPMVSLVVALATRSWVFPSAVDEVLERFSNMLAPLALASVGWQFDLSTLRGNAKFVTVGLTWKLVLAPAMVAAFLLAMHPELTDVDRVAIAQAGMAPMATAGVVATEFNLRPQLASALIAVGTPLSVLAVSVWWLALS